MINKHKIPLKLIELDDQSFHLLAEAFINDIKLNLVIDTGASKTVFDRKILESTLSYNDNMIHEIQSAGIMADNIDSKMATADIFRIGDLEIHDFPVIMIDLEAINRLYLNATGMTIHGLLGSDFLLNHKADIDYGRLVMVLKKSSS
jgi:hypothetical protein